MIYQETEIKLDYSKISVESSESAVKLKVFVPNLEGDVAGYMTARPTVLILPGGGYEFLSEREAEPIAMRFLAKGYNAAVLYYSIAPAARFPVSLLETLSAVKYLRENADRMQADKNKIYVCGFSAGGHLAASVGTLWNGAESKSYFGDTEAVRPNGLILAYPVIINDFDGETRIHKGSFNALLGDKKDDKQMLEYVCLDRRVSRDTPPTFIWSTFEDDCVPCESTLRFASALRKNGVPFELHIYEKGWHGLSTCDTIANTCCLRAGNWLNEVCAWLGDERSAYLG